VPSRDKRLEAIRRRPKQVRFSEILALLSAFGFEDRSGKGDHRVFGHPLLPYHISIDPRRPFILAVYVRNAVHAIDEVRAKMTKSGPR
jgi:hypothetical protein